MSVVGVVTGVQLAIRSQDPGPLTEALRTTADATPIDLLPGSNAASQTGDLPQPWNELLAAHLNSLRALHREGDIEAAYNFQRSAFNVYQNAQAQVKESNWDMPAFHMVCNNLRVFAIAADRAADTNDHLEEASTLLRKAFNITFNDRSKNNSKKYGCLYIINIMFKASFRLHKLTLCKTLVRSAESPAFPALTSFPVRDQVTYHYYRGRLAMFDMEYGQAQEHLLAAFGMCSRQSMRNVRLALMYLVPVNMLMGSLPSRLLKRYELEQFAGIVDGVKQGNLALFNETLQQHQEYFIRAGILLVLEKLRVLAYRNLFKRLMSLMGTYNTRIQVPHTTQI